MSDRAERARAACESALKAIDERLQGGRESRTSGDSMPVFTDDVLRKIRQELVNMIACLNPERYAPVFGRFLADQYDPHETLMDVLWKALDCYDRIRPGDAPP